MEIRHPHAVLPEPAVASLAIGNTLLIAHASELLDSLSGRAAPVARILGVDVCVHDAAVFVACVAEAVASKFLGARGNCVDKVVVVVVAGAKELAVDVADDFL
jgi:hypothetical protein